jgi:hypothetical protein
MRCTTAPRALSAATSSAWSVVLMLLLSHTASAEANSESDLRSRCSRRCRLKPRCRLRVAWRIVAAVSTQVPPSARSPFSSGVKKGLWLLTAALISSMLMTLVRAAPYTLCRPPSRVVTMAPDGSSASMTMAPALVSRSLVSALTSASCSSTSSGTALQV